MGGLGALQAATLLAALPFCFIMLLLAVGLVRQTNADLAGVALPDEAPMAERLKRLLVPARRGEIVRQLAGNGDAALRSVHEALQKEGWADSTIEVQDDHRTLILGAQSERAFTYRLTPRSRPLAAYTALEASEERRSKAWFLAAETNGNARYRDLTGFTAEQIAADVLTQLERWRLGA